MLIEKNVSEKMSLQGKKQSERKPIEEKRLMDAGILLIASALLIGGVCQESYYAKLKQSEAVFEELRESTESMEAVIEEETEETQYCEAVYDFSELREQNEDIYAWIIVPGTQVDYPVVQSETDNYYLDHNLDHSTGYPGCIYSNQCNVKDFSDYNTVLYGHNMKNGSMFGCLHSFEEQEFFNENSEITVYTEEKCLIYEIYAAVKFTDAYIPAYYDTTTADGRDKFLAAVIEESENSVVSHINENIEILPEDKVITLSTCVKGEDDKRYLVVGVLRDEIFYEN